MASMYSAKVMEHFANPHNVGELICEINYGKYV